MSIQHSECDFGLRLPRRDIAKDVSICRLLLRISISFNETKFVEE